MRKELQNRVATVAKALQRLAGPEEMLEINNKIKLLVTQVATGKLTPEQLEVKKGQIAQLNKILLQLNKAAA